ncbi:MAG: EI24 domain-containing protein [Bacteroidota bacterium]
MIQDIKDGFGAYILAWRHIRKYKLWGYVLLPGLFAIIYGAIILFGAITFSGAVAEVVGAKYPWEFGLAFVKKLGSALGVALSATLGFLSFKYAILITVSPFMSPLSEHIERTMKGMKHVKHSFSLKEGLKDMGRSVRLSIRNIIREFLIYLLIIIVGAIFPIIGLLSTVIYFIFQAYFAGFGNMDYTLERHMDIKGTVAFVRKYPGLAIANGTIFLLLIFFVPFIGVFLAPALATAAATIETVRRMDEVDESQKLIQDAEYV